MRFILLVLIYCLVWDERVYRTFLIVDYFGSLFTYGFGHCQESFLKETFCWGPNAAQES
jgi:hypothetical protein